MISEADFWTLFKPKPSPNPLAGDHIWEWEDAHTQDLHHVWTIVETGSEDENWYAVAGFHVVNIIGYAVTEMPWTWDDTQAVWFEDDRVRCPHDDWVDTCPDCNPVTP